MRIYLPKFRIANSVIPTSLLRKFELLTKANSKSCLFQPLSSIHYLAFFLVEVKQIFTNFLTADHNLGSSRTTPSRLGGFTSKSNKCHKKLLHKAQMLTKIRSLSTHHLGFLTNHTFLTKRRLGEFYIA
jgi:hypothetical protein